MNGNDMVKKKQVGVQNVENHLRHNCEAAGDCGEMFLQVESESVKLHWLHVSVAWAIETAAEANSPLAPEAGPGRLG